jgi:hypothetical protein
MESFGFPLAVPGSANAKNRAPITCAHAQGMQRVGLPLAVPMLSECKGSGLPLIVPGLAKAKGRAPISCTRLSESKG